MSIFFIVVFLFYYFSLLTLSFGWARLSDESKGHLSQTQHTLSVVIAFRNESANLPHLVRQLKSQSYSQSKTEIILVNDHSEDQSVESIATEINCFSIKLVELPEQMRGKKAALDFGIRQATGEIIVTTDADCHLPSNWLLKINEQFRNDEIKMVTGLVRIEEFRTMFSKLQALEFVSLIGSTGATFGLGLPTMCNGANLAYLKSAYEEVKGFEGNEEVPSGDDEFLMRKFLLRWRKGVKFMDDELAIVSTSPKVFFGDWMNQRLRWAGKWRYNSSAITKAVALTVLCFHSFFLLFLAFSLTGQFTLKQFGLLWGTKMFVEAVFLIPVCLSLKLRWRWLSFFVLQFIYSFYVVGIGILSQLKGYDWKGRRWNPTKP
jgi:biofilm PGA synthesis N-glycosyltransferase PgaC